MTSRNSNLLRRTCLRLRYLGRQKIWNTKESTKTSYDGLIDLKPNEYKVLLHRLQIANTIVLIILIFVIVGCSATEKLAKTTSEIQTNAQSSLTRFNTIQNETQTEAPNLLLISEESVGGQREQQSIIDLTQVIHKTLPAVEDQTPYWANLLQYGAIAAIVLGVAWILWYTGIGSILKRLVGFIPQPKKREASLVASVLDTSSETGLREYVAAKRASDPEFDRAFKKAKQERLEKS